MYVVTFNLAQPNFARIEYWLRQINAVTTGRPPILLVGTHRDQCAQKEFELMVALEKRFRQPWCGNIRAVLSVSCTSSQRTGLDELKQCILDTAQSMLWPLQMPAYYLALRQLLSETPEELLSVGAFQKRVAARLPQLSPTHIHNALVFFHQVGLLMYFSDMPQLRDLIVLDPRWLARVMRT